MNNNKALLNPAPPQGQEERINAVFKMAEEMIGFVPAGMRLYGVSPDLLELFAGTVGYFRKGTRLSAVLTTMIRYLVSEQARCNFCVELNEVLLEGMGIDMNQARAAIHDVNKAPLEEKEKILLKLALNAVSDKPSETEKLINTARDAHWGEREIFDAVVQATSNRAFNMVLKTFNIQDQTAFV